MVSRETGVHFLCVVAGIAAPIGLTWAGVTNTFTGQMVALGLSYGLTFAGAHLYFALQGEDGMVPVMARWRFVGLVLAAIVFMVIAIGANDTEVAGLQVRSLAGWAFAVVVAAYFLFEGVSGYRQSMQEP